MILADSSVWIGHLRSTNETLLKLLYDQDVLCHAAVIGELAAGNLANRRTFLSQLSHLPTAVAASHQEVLTLIEENRLFGIGVGYLDLHLLASTRLTPGARLWTQDRRLQDAAQTLDLAAVLDH
ncbi:type II toxin-antitoxin system VapC family toxin [Brevundimonas sp. SL130]|uniref:type II toxin-antitoxin system VapC family toxin n=1 Tax=Brevundimonas sp. SL130 TaxID=2995143 RepID=UPI00226D0611|nr:VapC toxin family PIN domain ribonuclease [Brevundimonas sp. SL130]WAC61106.1 VapC toxin family PIN domain ribonuclease [Brevundimonas sp. SL130]